MRQCNAGVGAARNTAIRRARGKYIAPLDADDLFYPEKLEKQVACIEQYGTETGLVYCGTALIDERGDFCRNVLPGEHLQIVEGRLRHAMVLSNVVGNASVPLIRATALEKVGLYLTRAEQRGAQGCEDWDLHIRVAEHCSIRIVPEYLLAYRQICSGMSVNAESMAASFAVMMRRARERNSDLPDATFRWSAGYFYKYLVGKSDEWNHHSWSFRYLKKCVSANPYYFLEPWTYRKLIKFSLKSSIGPIWNQIVRQVRPSFQKEKQRADLHSNKKSKRPFISNLIFEHIETRVWSAALYDGN